MHYQNLEKLKRLKLFGMARALEELQRLADRGQLDFADQLALLIDREASDRANTALLSRLRQARLRQTASAEVRPPASSILFQTASRCAPSRAEPWAAVSASARGRAAGNNSTHNSRMLTLIEQLPRASAAATPAAMHLVLRVLGLERVVIRASVGLAMTSRWRTAALNDDNSCRAISRPRVALAKRRHCR